MRHPLCGAHGRPCAIRFAARARSGPAEAMKLTEKLRTHKRIEQQNE